MKPTFFLSLTFIASAASQSACPGNGAITGYTTIAEINNAIAADLSAIKRGSKPSPPYVFTFCPGTVFTSSQPLTATLSGAEFVCGKTGAVADLCVIEGGSNQVLIQEPSISGYALKNVTFKGITFSGSTDSSVVANASSATTASFIDCDWSSFSGSAAVRLSSTSAKAATVMIDGGNVPNGTSAAIFSNDNGTLDINALNITGFNGADGIITSNGGATSIQSADISGLGTGLQKVLYAEGTGTTLNVNNTRIRGISPVGGLWDGITYAQGASGVVEGIQFIQNSGVEFAISAIDGGVVNVSNTLIEGNTAGSGGYTSLFYALNNSKLYLLNDDATGNNGFFFYGFTGFQSHTSYENTTFEGGSVTLAVFIDQDSTVNLKNINITNVLSQACKPPLQQEFIEDVGSACFYRGPGGCTGVCGVVLNITKAPTVVPSRSPVASPTIAPVAKTVAPTISPSATTSAPVVKTGPPTTFPSTATLAPAAVTAVPTISPSGSTSMPMSLTLAPSAVPVTTPTTHPITPTKTPVVPSKPVLVTATPTAGVGKVKAMKKGPNAKKGLKKSKGTKKSPTAAGKKGKQGNTGVGKKATGASKTQIAYNSGAPKMAKGAATPPRPGVGKGKGITNKKPKLVKGNEGSMKAGLVKNAKASKAGKSTKAESSGSTLKESKSPTTISVKGKGSYTVNKRNPSKKTSTTTEGSYTDNTTKSKATKSPTTSDTGPTVSKTSGGSYAYGVTTSKGAKSPTSNSNTTSKNGAPTPNTKSGSSYVAPEAKPATKPKPTSQGKGGKKTQDTNTSTGGSKSTKITNASGKSPPVSKTSGGSYAYGATTSTGAKTPTSKSNGTPVSKKSGGSYVYGATRSPVSSTKKGSYGATPVQGKTSSSENKPESKSGTKKTSSVSQSNTPSDGESYV